MKKYIKDPFITFLTAVQFLLISPAFIKRPFTAQELGGGTAFYPLVGAILGGILVGADWLLGLIFPVGPRSALVLALGVLLTGALHLDGFLDSCDGLLGGFTPEQRLEIMRDERVGAYALAGGILVMLLQYSALSSLDGTLRWQALLLAPVIGRLTITQAIYHFPYARPKGLGRDIKDHVGLAQALVSSVSAMFIMAASALLPAPHTAAVMNPPVIGAFSGILIFWGVTGFITRRIPGLTGDSYGAINVLVETSVLLAFSTLTAWV